MSKLHVHTPEWVRHAVFYQIFPDRFATSKKVPKPRNLEGWDATPTHHGFKGGDLLGVAEHLDYLLDLGVNAIYFNPIFASAANHRYHTYDYYTIDPILGGNEAFRILLDEAHKRDIKVIIDGVFNHASRGFFQFHHLLENGPYSPYIDWFRVRAWPLNAYESAAPPNYEAWWNLPALPKFNTDNDEVREFLWSVGEYWVRFGIDGWRLDVPGEINDDSFWEEFRARVKRANPEAYIVGEIWENGTRWLQGDQFDAVMNYLFTKVCMEFFIGGDNADQGLVTGSPLYPLRTINSSQFASDIQSLLALYPRAITDVQLNLLDSHDTARFLSIAKGDATALRLATLMQMVYPGAPCIYYGDEIGMAGGKEPASRAGFEWDRSEWDTDLRNFFKKSIALRQAHPALRTGEYITLHTDEAVYAMGRQLDDDRVLVAFNTSRGIAEASIPVGEFLPEGTTLVDAFKKDRVRVENGRVEIRILPRSAVAFEVKK